jgi:hypothetical protein
MLSEDKAVWRHPPPPVNNGKNVLQQMGGLPALTDFIYGFYDRMLVDKEMGAFLKKSQQTQSEAVYIKLLKDRTIEYLEIVWGGDAWEGQDMFVAHAALHISTKIYDAALKLARAQLKAQGITGAVQKVIMDEMELMREPICDPTGKFHKWVMDKNKKMEEQMLAEGAVDLHGMGFTSSPAFVKAMEDKQKRDQDRKERLQAQKEKRKAEEKAAKKKHEPAKEGNKEKEHAKPAQEIKHAKDAPSDASSSSVEKKAASPVGSETGSPEATERSEVTPVAVEDDKAEKVKKVGTKAGNKSVKPKATAKSPEVEAHSKTTKSHAKQAESHSKQPAPEVVKEEPLPELPPDGDSACVPESYKTPLPQIMALKVS